MTNEQLIKIAHVWAIGILLTFGILAFAANTHSQNQNSNQNSNANTTGAQNRNTGNKKSRNANMSTPSGAQVSAAAMASADKNFLSEAAMGGLMEVELGRLAAQQGTTDAVKQFGQRMVDDHSKANSELMTLAASKGITLPTELDEKHRAEVTKMSKLTGAEFDKSYARSMLEDHKKDVAAFEKASTKGSDADVKAFASKTLPTLKEHLEMAQALNGKPANAPASKPKNSNRP